MRLARSLLAPPPPAPAAPPSGPLGSALHAGRDALGRRDFEVAEACFTRALSVDATCAMAHVGRIVALLSMGRDEEASFALDAALARDAQGEVGFALARTFVAMGHEGEAMDLLGLVLETRPALAASLLKDRAFRKLRDHPRFLQLAGAL
jgi:tetratricopeptide (TPR) repeat protein